MKKCKNQQRKRVNTNEGGSSGTKKRKISLALKSSIVHPVVGNLC